MLAHTIVFTRTAKTVCSHTNKHAQTYMYITDWPILVQYGYSRIYAVVAVLETLP